jgi:hypothetical protein
LTLILGLQIWMSYAAFVPRALLLTGSVDVRNYQSASPPLRRAYGCLRAHQVLRVWRILNDRNARASLKDSRALPRMLNSWWLILEQVSARARLTSPLQQIDYSLSQRPNQHHLLTPMDLQRHVFVTAGVTDGVVQPPWRSTLRMAVQQRGV